MTNEEIKQLKPGDEIFIRARYKDRLRDGDVLFSHSITNADDKEKEYAEWYTHPENVISSLSSPENVIKNTETDPKYDPFRLFKKGDRVRIVKYAGRCYTTFWESFVGVEMYVETSETAYSLPEVETAKGLQPIDPAYLELVTPVEEWSPYGVEKNIHGWIVYKDNYGNVVANFNNTHPHAKEAAEAECARLNAEYRKGVCNG